VYEDASCESAFGHGAVRLGCVRVLLTLVAAEKALPFDLKVPNALTAAAMKGARAGGLSSFKNVSELMADLNAED